MWMKLRSALTFAICVVAFTTVAAQNPNPMRPGRWEVTMQMQMASMPMKMPPTKTSSCITAEQLAKDPTTGLNTGTGPNQCKVTDQKFTGNTVAWKMTCGGQQAMTGDGEMTFTDDTYTGAVNMTTPQGAMTMQMSGKRVGDCTQ
jgi:hypothetical protein